MADGQWPMPIQNTWCMQHATACTHHVRRATASSISKSVVLWHMPGNWQPHVPCAGGRAEERKRIKVNRARARASHVSRASISAISISSMSWSSSSTCCWRSSSSFISCSVSACCCGQGCFRRTRRRARRCTAAERPARQHGGRVLVARHAHVEVALRASRSCDAVPALGVSITPGDGALALVAFQL